VVSGADPAAISGAVIGRPGRDHPTTVFLSVHKGASTFLADHFAPAMVGHLDGLRHIAIGQELAAGRSMDELALPPRGVVATRVYPRHFNRLLEAPAPPRGRLADKALIMLRRDPRDAAVSLYYSVRYSHAEPPATDPKWRRRFQERRAMLERLNVQDGITQLTARTAMREFLRTEGFLRRFPATLLTTYERLVGDFPGWLEQVRQHLGWSDELARAIGAGLQDQVKAPPEEDPRRHKRRVTPGNWREVFDDRLCERFERRLGRYLTEAGYGW
jgi:hypothetical protein